MAESRGTILVVEDEVDIREMLAAGLGATGYAMLLADDGEQAIELFESHRADLVICDIKMPGLNGIETIARLREQDPGVPIIVLTGHLDPDTVEHCAGLEGVELVRKPFLFNDLADAVQAALRRPRLGSASAQIDR